METQQIKALLGPFVSNPLSNPQLGQVSVYLDLLLKWNAKMNLTAVRRPEEIMARHFGESFFAAEKLMDTAVLSVIDLGSGAGFPGLPLAIYSPKTRVTLVESQNKKATFLKEIVRSLGLENATVFRGRGEDYPGKADLVTLRAVDRFETAIDIAVSLLQPKGTLGLLIGAGQQENLPPGFVWNLSNRVPGGSSRLLAIGSRRVESRE